jgi:hypothetical protein
MTALEVSGGAKATLTNVSVSAGERTDVSREFVTGTLKIGVVKDGELVDATTNVSGAAGKAVAGGRTYTAPSSNPRTYELPPGSYSVVINPIRVPGATRRTVNVEVTAGETTLETVDYSQ